MPRRNPTTTPNVGLRCANPTYQLAYPPGLPRAASARRELWLQGRVLTSAGWRRLFVALDTAAGLPPRLARLPLRLVLTPGWLPWRLRAWREGK